jgi:hypothetical protein
VTILVDPRFQPEMMKYGSIGTNRYETGTNGMTSRRVRLNTIRVRYTHDRHKANEVEHWNTGTTEMENLNALG